MTPSNAKKRHMAASYACSVRDGCCDLRSPATEHTRRFAQMPSRRVALSTVGFRAFQHTPKKLEKNLATLQPLQASFFPLRLVCKEHSMGNNECAALALQKPAHTGNRSGGSWANLCDWQFWWLLPSKPSQTGCHISNRSLASI